MFLYVLKLFVMAFLGVASIGFITLAVIKRKERRQLALYLTLSIIFILATVKVSLVDLFSAETVNREAAVDAFEANFGFKPPDSVDDIKLKNFAIYDSYVHWMAFTYDSAVVHEILVHDQPLDTADRDTPKFDEILKKLEKGCSNCPDWLEVPNSNVVQIYYKMDFLKHTSSEYYLWVDNVRKTVYLQVSYFD